MPQNPQNSREYHPDLRYRLDLERKTDGMWGDANDDCKSGEFDRDIDFDVWWRENLNVGGQSNFDISSSCPVGSYRVRAKAFYDSSDDEVAFDIREFTIIPGPSVEIDVSSTSIMRGVQTDVTLRFTHLNNIQEDPTLSYRADIMRIISENSRNFANECEGTGLGNIDKTNDADNNFSDSVSGSLDDQDGDGTAEVSGQIAATCSTGRYELKVSLWDASKKELTSKKLEFVVSTDAGATPSAQVSMSESSPVTPGTEFTITFSFYDLQDGAAIRYLDTLTNTGTNQPVGRMVCGGSGVGWGQDVSSTVIRNPIVNRITITSDCPEGSYRLKSLIQDNSGNEIVSESANFTIGNPPAVRPAATASSGSQQPPSQQQQPSEATATPTATTTPTATPTDGGNNQDGNNPIPPDPNATPTATSTATSESQQRQQQVQTGPTATPTATRQQGGGNQGGNQGNNQGGNNQGRSNNQGGGNQGGGVQSFVDAPTPSPPPASSPQQSQTPLAITVPEIMNVRTGPGLTYDIVTTVPAGTQATIVGIAPDNDWYQVEIAGVEGQVWIYQGLTTLVGSLTGVKQYTALEIAQLTGTPGSDGSVPLAITVPITMNVRTGPGLTYDVVRIVPAGTQGRIFGIDPDDDWFQIELEGLDTLVWVYQDLTTVIGSLAGVKWVTAAEIAMLPAAITQPALLNARAGPGTTYDILTTVPQGTWAQITGIDTLGDWYRVELDDLDQPAWIFRDYTKVAGGSLSGLIQIAVGGTPSPTVGLLTSSITVELSLPQAGGVDLDVSWLDASACAQLYSLYHRASTDSTTYISLEQAATVSTVNSKSLSFSTLSGSSFISAWCGTMAAGREIAEVEIDPGVAGTYSSTTTSGGLAAAPPSADDGSR